MHLSLSSFALFCGFTFSLACLPAVAEFGNAVDGITLAADVNNDGIADFALHAVSVSKAKYDVISGADGTKLASFDFPDSETDSFHYSQFHWVADRDKDGVKDIGLFGYNGLTDKYQFILKSSKTGQSLGTWTWNNSLFLPEFHEIDDITLDGMTEFGLLGTHSVNSTLQFQVRDGLLKSPIATFKWPNIWDNPQVVTMSDVTGDNIPEVALYGVNKRRGNGQLFAYDGALSTNKLDVYNWGKHWENLSLFKLDDIDGDGTVEWGQFGKRADDGRYQMLIKRGNSKTGMLRTLTWNSTMNTDKPIIVDDLTDDGISEIALAGFDTDLRFKILVNDGRLPNKRINNITWPLKWSPASRLVRLHDIDGDGINEVGLLGPNTTNGNVTLSIKSLVTGKELTQYEWDKQWTIGLLGLEIFDANNDGVLDFALTGYQDLSFYERISVLSGTIERAVIFDKIVGEQRTTLDSFLTALSDTDVRFNTSLNDAYRADDTVLPLLFDGTLLHRGSVSLPYTVNNSLLTLHHNHGDEVINFLYVADDFGVAKAPDSELSIYTKSSFNVQSTDRFESSMLIGKVFSFIMDDAGALSKRADPLIFNITFLSNEQALVSAEESFFVSWSIDAQGRLVVHISDENGDDDFVFARVADDKKLFVIKDVNRNNKPLLMSDDILLPITILNNWLISN